LIETVCISLSKEEFLISKINSRKYQTIGNFSKHLKSNGYSIESYMIEFFKEYLPKCLESGNISDYRKKGYWNYWYPLTYRHRDLVGKYKHLQRAISRVCKEGKYTEYLDINYWLNKEYKFSEAILKIHSLIRKEYYLKLHDSYYDKYWTESSKVAYINSILDGRILPLPNLYTVRGLQFRGQSDVNEIAEILSEFYKHRPTVFRDPEIQKQNNIKRQIKYSPAEQRKFSIRCVEYWLDKGYSLVESIQKVSDVQKLNTIDSIKERLNCDDEIAKEVQREIYQKRLNSFKNKDLEELNRIYKSQDSSSFEYCLRKCNFDKKWAEILYKELQRKKIVPLGRASKESLKYFIPLYKFLRKKGILREDIYLGVNGSTEYFLYDEDSKKIRMYDFVVRSRKIIIEYDGVYWHSDVDSKYNDVLKDKLAIKNGYKLLRISSENSIDFNNILIYEFIDENL